MTYSGSRSGFLGNSLPPPLHYHFTLNFTINPAYYNNKFDSHYVVSCVYYYCQCVYYILVVTIYSTQSYVAGGIGKFLILYVHMHQQN